MPKFEPFRGILYDTRRVALDEVIAPPYDVIDEELRAGLEGRSPHNAVRLDLPRDVEAHDRYEEARCLLRAWLDAGVLRLDDRAAYYVYRMGFTGEDGSARHTTGVIGSMGLEAPGEGILPHELTMSKPKDDRLNMLRSCRANTSAIWGLSLAEGLTELCVLDTEPDAHAVDPDGVSHSLWRITDDERIAAITAAVESTPVLIADGHHRFETSLAFQAERREAGDGPGGHDGILTYVVELTADELDVRPIHRLLQGVPAGYDLADAFGEWFEVTALSTSDPETLPVAMAEAGGLGLVVGNDAWVMVPRAGAFDGVDELDSSRLEHALSGMDAAIERSYQHGVANAVAAITKGEADAAVLLRPATIDQIAATAHGGDRMPPKTTFFHPKPRTGMVFRPLDA